MTVIHGGSMDLVLEVWREVGRHLEVGESVGRISELLQPRIPHATLSIRGLVSATRRVETLAVAGPGGPRAEGTGRVELTPSAFIALENWCRGGTEVDECPLRGEAPLTLLAPTGAAGYALAGALAFQGTPLGAVVVARSARPFTAEERALLRQLLEPLAANVANHRRLHELERLREAVEAEKRALLSRLERDDISDGIVGGESGLREVMARVEQVAPTDVPVLILGETGSGKEVIARAIHARSRRSGGPMVRVNCGAIPSELVDSELFGHERGSFTGAVATRKGWFERADGGTLFLDEIGELPPPAQVRLLRVLQDGMIERVGGQRTLTVDVRVVAATNEDLAALTARGAFRRDLWYRIGVFPLRLPPLRDRPQDIPALAAHFAWRAGRRLGSGPLIPSAADLDLLLAYPWPGNVRELAAVIERAAILGGGRRLEVANALGVADSRDPAVVPPSPAVKSPASTESPPRLETLGQAMARHIEKALEATRGRVEGPRGAARLLGINPHTLRARMRKLGVEWRRFRRPPGERS